MRVNSKYRVAIVTEHLWKMGGANRVLECFCEIFPNSDIYALFGHSKREDQLKNLSEEVCKHKMYFSNLNKIPFIKKIYQYTFNQWIKSIEKFNFSEYDLVISSSSSVAHGVITPLNCKHISYIHSPMRYIWDLNNTYFRDREDSHSTFVSCISKPVFHFARIWDITASNRSDILIANSQYVQKRIKKYWRKDATVIYPPSSLFIKEIEKKRENYYVCIAPFEKNKRGKFLFERAKQIGFHLKIIGSGSEERRLARKFKSCKNIEILGWVSEDKKWDLLSKASGYIIPGIEDYGISVVEALSCGTPILAYNQGGALESVTDSVNGFFFKDNDFNSVFEKFRKRKWEYSKIPKSLRNYSSRESFKQNIRKIFRKNGIMV